MHEKYLLNEKLNFSADQTLPNLFEFSHFFIIIIITKTHHFFKKRQCSSMLS